MSEPKNVVDKVINIKYAKKKLKQTLLLELDRHTMAKINELERETHTHALTRAHVQAHTQGGGEHNTGGRKDHSI